MDRGAWGATGHKVTKSLDTTEWLMLSPSLFEFNQKLNATECLQQPIGELDIYEKVTDLIVWCQENSINYVLQVDRIHTYIETTEIIVFQVKVLNIYKCTECLMNIDW